MFLVNDNDSHNHYYLYFSKIFISVFHPAQIEALSLAMSFDVSPNS